MPNLLAVNENKSMKPNPNLCDIVFKAWLKSFIIITCSFGETKTLEIPVSQKAMGAGTPKINNSHCFLLKILSTKVK